MQGRPTVEEKLEGKTEEDPSLLSPRCYGCNCPLPLSLLLQKKEKKTTTSRRKSST